MKLHFPLLSTKLNTINQHLDETKYLLVELPIVANFYGKPADLLTWYLNKSKWVSSIYLKVSLIDNASEFSQWSGLFFHFGCTACWWHSIDATIKGTPWERLGGGIAAVEFCLFLHHCLIVEFKFHLAFGVNHEEKEQSLQNSPYQELSDEKRKNLNK